MPIGRARTLTAAIGTAVAVTIAAVGCASTPTHHAAAHVAATATPTPSATPTPTPAPPLTSTASVTRKHPIVGTKVGIVVSTVPNARITVVAHFETGDRKKTAARRYWPAHLLVPDRQRHARIPGQGGCPRVGERPDPLQPDMVHPAPEAPSAATSARPHNSASPGTVWLLPQDRQRQLL